jgi:tRNA-intron endonuclease
VINLSKEEQSKKNSKIIVAEIKGNKVVIGNHQDARIVYDNGYYGQLNDDKTLTLNFEEALHLLERGVLKIVDEKGLWLEVSDCARIFMEREKDFWTDYLVFKDLRNRGYIVGQGISDIVRYRVYPRGAKVGQDVAKVLICPLSESRSINLETLDKISIQTKSLQKKLLVACVDRLGDVSYYELQSLFDKVEG